MFKLRELEKKDLPAINQWRNNKEVIDSLGAPYRFINSEVDENWYDSYMQNRGNAIRCAVTEKDNDKILCLVSLTSIDFLNQSAKLHIMIGEQENQNRGIGTFAVRSMLLHAFCNMNLHRIELSVLDSNKRAIHLYEKCGFVKEGLKRKCSFKNGKFENMYIYSILKEDFAIPQNSGGGRIIPDYCIDEPVSLQEKEITIRICDSAFTESIIKNEKYKELIDKINIYAVFFRAYSSECLGYAAMYANDRQTKTAYITLIGVLPLYQKKGIGKRLLNICCETAEKKKMKAVRLEVKKDNKNAIRFYSKNGFRYICDASQYSLYMQKELL